MSTRATSTLLRTAGSVVAVDDHLGALQAAALAAAGTCEPYTAAPNALADITVSLERGRRRFDLSDYEPVTRGAWVGPSGDTVIESAGSSGFVQHWSITEHGLQVRSRWAPSATEAAAAVLLPARFRALRAQVLVHYPALWWAAYQGHAPLHVSVLEIDGVAVLLAGPGGVGKSTLVARELAAGATATCDNLAVCDGVLAYGLTEPLRLPADVALGTRGGSRTTNGRREQAWRGHVPTLRPDLVVVVRRGAQSGPQVRPISASNAQRALIAGTYAAGELRRFWPLAAVLALATGRGPVHPAVELVAGLLTARLPCFELQLGRRPGPPLAEMLADQLAEVRREGLSR
jgi:hypothetical protein